MGEDEFEVHDETLTCVIDPVCPEGHESVWVCVGSGVHNVASVVSGTVVIGEYMFVDEVIAASVFGPTEPKPVVAGEPKDAMPRAA